MTPLDLSTKCPRSSHVEIDGVAYLARAIDKARAQLPGGNIGPYVVLRPEMLTMTSMLYHRMGIKHEDFMAAVAAASDDAEVGAWLRAQTNDESIVKWNRQILNTKLSDLPADTLPRVFKAHPGASDMPPETLLIDVFDADDVAMFSGKA